MARRQGPQEVCSQAVLCVALPSSHPQEVHMLLLLSPAGDTGDAEATSVIARMRQAARQGTHPQHTDASLPLSHHSSALQSPAGALRLSGTPQAVPCMPGAQQASQQHMQGSNSPAAQASELQAHSAAAKASASAPRSASAGNFASELSERLKRVQASASPVKSPGEVVSS